ncbi:MAG: nucleotidyl transferase AbiEii/AbiGii toxin family protein [Bacteroidota bacterium]
MIDFQAIVNSYPPSLRPFRRFLLREYLQCKILSLLFRQPETAARLCFLGGTCLSLVHGNRRFSEDLDFDNRGLKEADFDEATRQVKTGLEEEGYEVTIKNVMKGAWRCSIRFPGLLFQAGLSGHVEESILIQVDMQPQQFDYSPESYLLNRFDLFLEIAVTPLDLLLAQKCYAIFNRNRAKGRDFYDAVFLFGKTAPNYAYLAQKTGIADAEALKTKLLETCQQLDMAALAEDVKPFLFDPNDALRVSRFEAFIRQAL